MVRFRRRKGFRKVGTGSAGPAKPHRPKMKRRDPTNPRSRSTFRPQTTKEKGLRKLRGFFGRKPELEF